MTLNDSESNTQYYPTCTMPQGPLHAPVSSRPENPHFAQAREASLREGVLPAQCGPRSASVAVVKFGTTVELVHNPLTNICGGLVKLQIAQLAWLYNSQWIISILSAMNFQRFRQIC